MLQCFRVSLLGATRNCFKMWTQIVNCFFLCSNMSHTPVTMVPSIDMHCVAELSTFDKTQNEEEKTEKKQWKNENYIKKRTIRTQTKIAAFQCWPFFPYAPNVHSAVMFARISKVKDSYWIWYVMSDAFSIIILFFFCYFSLRSICNAPSSITFFHLFALIRARIQFL